MVDFIARDMLFPLPENVILRFPRDYQYSHEEVYTPVWEGSGRTVPCVVVGHASTNRRILFFHGNSETIASSRKMALALAVRCSARVFIIDYPGYWIPDDGSHPKARTARAVYAAAAFAAKVLHKEFGSFHVVGYSLGTTLAVRAARDHGNAIESLSLIAPICSALSAAASSPNDELWGTRTLVRIVKPFISPLDVFCAERDAPFVGRADKRTNRRPTRCAVVYGGADQIVHPSQSVRMANLLHAAITEVKIRDHDTILWDDDALNFVTRNVCDGGPTLPRAVD